MNKTEETVNKRILFPENRKIKEKLFRGDKATLAEYTGLTIGTISEMMKGNRRFTPIMENAIIRLFSERKERHEALNKIIKQS